LIAELLEHGYEELVDIEKRSWLASLRYDIERLFEVLHSASDLEKVRIARLEYKYLPVLDERKSAGSLVIHKELSNDPDLFIEVLKHVYRPSGIEDDMPDGPADWIAARAELSWQLLESWRRLPGLKEDGGVDGKELMTWITRARTGAADVHRAVHADLMIGKLLAHAPVDEDGAWPCKAVRDVLEAFEIEEIDSSILCECYNIRGKAGFVGERRGEEERELAAETREWARAIEHHWPRTAALLDRLADEWDRDAEREQIRQAQADLRR
jgi:hypothetical protein